jgi:HAD superfamily hydrolase (TIGR01509 family)
MALQAVMFDMDGLLVDTEPLWFEAESQVMARLGGSWSHADQAHLIGGSLVTSVGYMLARATMRATTETVASWLVDGMVALLMDGDLPWMPGARELLADVAAAGIPCALVTSSERPIMDAVIGKIGVAFDATVCAADVGAAKPAPEPYLLAAKLLGADPPRCVVLEDSPNGIAAAEAAGCRVIAVPSLLPIPVRAGRLVAASLAEINLGMLRAVVSAR